MTDMTLAHNAATPHLETVAANLALWQSDMNLTHELSLLQIKDALTRYLALNPTGTDAASLRQFAAELCTCDPHEGLLRDAQQLAQRLIFCKTLCALCPDFKSEETPVSTIAAPIQGAVIAQLSNPTFEEALTRFTPLVPNASPLLYHGFAEVLEAVSVGKAPFGMIPLEDSTEGKLFRFYEQIEQHELQIVATADIPTANKGGQVRVALLHKHALGFCDTAGKRMLECRLFEDRTTALPELLTIAAELELTLRRIDSIPVTYHDDGFCKHLVLEAKEKDPTVFLAYLALFMPRTAVTANYIHLS